MPTPVTFLQKRFQQIKAASQERFKQGKELVKRDETGKVIVPVQTSRTNIFQAASIGVEQPSASDS